MRVNELSKQIGKSNKEVLEILQKNHFDVKSHSSKVTEEQAEASQTLPCRSKGDRRQRQRQIQERRKQIEWKI